MSAEVTSGSFIVPAPAADLARETPQEQFVVICSTASVDVHSTSRTRPRNIQIGTVAITAVAVLLGVFLAAQWQSKPRPVVAAPEYRREIATATIERLEAEQAELKLRIREMRQHLATQQQQRTEVASDISRVVLDLEEQKMLAGTVSVRGPGLKILLDDSSVKTIPPKEDPAMYLVHEYQLRDVANVLWAAGAEAVAINGERLVAPTSIYCVGSTILVNDTRTSPPYEFTVLGDSARIEASLADSTILRALKSRIKIYGLQFTVQKLRELTVPAYTGGLDVRHVIVASAELSTRGQRPQIR